MKIIDARGLSCPEPLLQLQSAINDKENSYKVLATCAAARDNILRYAGKQGFQCDIVEKDGELEITLTR